MLSGYVARNGKQSFKHLNESVTLTIKGHRFVKGLYANKYINRGAQYAQALCYNLQFSYDLEMKTREQNRNNKRTEIERFDWFIERIQTRVAFGWLGERSDEKTSCPRTF